ncbi:CDGSH iron-sulfur domain-containing protein 1-like isoform X2 [Denticeps clupeoides]|uniref:CDGSH iron-sulfur domain-containing protein 1-like isoform X2 n=1 Tax=Denticeps clupeoides TaxID=299321 RepID=UPI0010A47B7D|nr:CDGSH iron-sulfur domain-containing protein 1-like isoform X2 [Denticeps clupeoides]XP_028823125.1 CDGSH iron-sulfur domain-containing protein 1-like isoform X2 [Denticeps clupeoides]
MATPPLNPLPKAALSSGFRLGRVAAVVGTYLASRYLCGRSRPKSQVNPTINKDSPKVVHSFDMEDIGSKAVYCRCWRSKKFPYCDGAHTKHNEETGDNVGPLIIKKRDV